MNVESSKRLRVAIFAASALCVLLVPLNTPASILYLPPVSVDPIVHRADGQVSFATEWSGADWMDDFLPFAGTYFGESKENWNALSSSGNTAMYSYVTCFLLHDIWGLTVQDDYDYNTFAIVGLGGTKITGWVFDDLNHPDLFDSDWIGGSGLYGPAYIGGVDDRGFIVRVNDDPTTDYHWYPGDPEPGDPTWSWPLTHGFFGTYGFNNTPYTYGLPGGSSSHSPNREVYEVAFRNPTETGSSGFPPGVTLYLRVCDVAGDRPDSLGNAMRMAGSNYTGVPDTMVHVPIQITAEDIARNFVFGDTASLPVNFRNPNLYVDSTSFFAYDSLGWGVIPSLGMVTVPADSEITVLFKVPIPLVPPPIGQRNRVTVETPYDTCYTWFRVADLLDRIEILPQSLNMHVNQVIFFSGIGYDSEDRVLHVNETAVWTLDNMIGELAPWPFEHVPMGVSMVSLRALMEGDAILTASIGSEPLGEVYIHVDPAPPLEVDLSYVSGSPVPPGGGNLYFDVYVANISGVAQNFDAWMAVAYEGGVPTTIVLRSFTNFQPGWTINRPGMYYPVVGAWPAGNYMMYANVGVYPDTVYTGDSFPFVKSGDDAVAGFVPYAIDGAPDPFEGEIVDGVLIPTHFEVGIYPNPFNPYATISYNLTVNSQVKMELFDITGRQVATLIDGWREVGNHEFTFDGSHLTSGIYLYRITAGAAAGVGKMVLMK